LTHWLKENVKTALVKRLTGTENRTYLWVHLIFPSIKESTETNEVELLRVINTLPRTVEEAYEEILTKSSAREKARKLLHIVIAASRSLTLAEMNVAMAIADGAKSETDLKSRLDQEDDFRKKVTNLCGLFVRVIGYNIYLVHQTAKEFLETPLEPSTNVVSGSDTWKHSLEPRESHLTLAKICISYVEFALDSHPLLIEDGANYWELRKEVNRYLKDHHFLAYAAKNWVTHFRGANSDPTLLGSAMNICDTQSQRFQTWFRIYWTTQYSSCPQQLTDIMVGSYFGLEVMVQRFLETGVKLDPRDDGGRTPLSWAAENGHVAVVQLLLKQDDLELNSKDNNGRTPLSWASGGGKEDVVRLLLLRGANIQIKDDKNRSALHWAVENGHKVTIRLLLRQADDIAVGDGRGPTLLYSTADSGYESLMTKLLKEGIDLTLFRAAGSDNSRVARLLVDVGANIDAKCLDKHTALLEAALKGHEEIVRLLLQNGADIKANDSDGKTVLHLASNNIRNQGLIRLLLDNGADVKAKDFSGGTALHTAARSGDEVAAGVLIGLQDVNINERDNYGQTPLSLGAGTGNEGVVQLLLKQDGVDLKSKDSSGYTPLLAAIKGQHVEERKGDRTTFHYNHNVRMRGAVVRLLLKRDDVELNAIGSHDQTALLMAASDGDADMVRLLLERGDVNPNVTDNRGRTALAEAALQGHTDIVRALLERGGVNQSVIDEDGGTTLIYAAQGGYEEMVRLLLPNAEKGVEGEKALREAAWHGNEQVVHLLLDYMYGGSNGDAKSKPEHWLATAQLPGAVKRGDEAAVQMLIGKGADLKAIGWGRETALMSAAELGYDKVAKLLLDNGANLKVEDSGRTALHFAAGGGHLAVVKLLFENGAAIDDDSIDGTALSLAAKGGHEAVVRLLLNKGARTESEKWTALHWAAWRGHRELVQLLVDNGANVETKSSLGWGEQSPYNGFTALCLAAWKCHTRPSRGHLEIVQLLAERGADATASNPDGSTALHLIAFGGPPR
jgi:ankyrin repeat protein